MRQPIQKFVRLFIGQKCISQEMELAEFAPAEFHMRAVARAKICSVIMTQHVQFLESAFSQIWRPSCVHDNSQNLNESLSIATWSSVSKSYVCLNALTLGAYDAVVSFNVCKNTA